jgi:hypothetical protein
MAIRYCALTTRPTDLHISQMNRSVVVNFGSAGPEAADRGYMELLPHQVNELNRAESSKTSRKGIASNYQVTEAQWRRLEEQRINYIYISRIPIDLRPPSRKQLSKLDKLGNCRPARIMLCARDLSIGYCKPRTAKNSRSEKCVARRFFSPCTYETGAITRYEFKCLSHRSGCGPCTFFTEGTRRSNMSSGNSSQRIAWPFVAQSNAVH